MTPAPLLGDSGAGLRWRIRRLLRSLDNYRQGFKFGYVRRCRVCDHTAYYPQHPDHNVRRATHA